MKKQIEDLERQTKGRDEQLKVKKAQIEKLNENINELIKLCSELADPSNFFMVLSLYSMGFSSLIADNLISSTFPKITNKEFGELYFPDKAKRNLPLGVFLRFKK